MVRDRDEIVTRSVRDWYETHEKNTIKMRAHLELLAELLNVSLPKDKKEAENLLFGENPPKRWSTDSLNQWKVNVLKAARVEVEEK